MTAFPKRRRLIAALALLLPRPAHAHAILLDSDPRHDTKIPAGERVLTLRFNSRLDIARSRLTLVRPDRSLAVLPLQSGADHILSATATLSPGRHVLRWQVLAIDGHITRGELPFTVAAP